MHVANIDVCKALYEVSGWKDTSKVYNFSVPGKSSISTFPHSKTSWCPAYDLGYLLRKLPQSSDKGGLLFLNATNSDKWSCGFKGGYYRQGDTPEEATAKLAIELFKQGVLTREGA
jgi:hypothetical protein